VNHIPARAKTVHLQFPANHLLPLLFGDHDRFLARIEARLGVRIAARGNRLAISGAESDTDSAEAALRSLYARLERGSAVGVAEVEAAIRMAVPNVAVGAAGGGGGAGPGSAEDGSPRLPLADFPSIRTRRGALEPRSRAQADYMDALARHDLVFGVGPAGTGKTYLAVAQAVAMLSTGRVDRIVLCRPAVEAGERLGFLPGDLKDKVDPYLRPLYDALHDMLPAEQVARRMTNGEIEIAPLAFMRGRTLSHAFVILDEAQNTTPMQMKMLLTRLGEGSRMAVTGDPSQTDLPPGQLSGLVDALDTVTGVDGVCVLRFQDRDVVRSALVSRIVAAYTAREGAREPGSASARDGTAREGVGSRRRNGPAATERSDGS